MKIKRTNISEVILTKQEMESLVTTKELLERLTTEMSETDRFYTETGDEIDDATVFDACETVCAIINKAAVE